MSCYHESMGSNSSKGNNPERWQKLLDVLDEKLQLGLLDHMRKVESYHFEDNTLFISVASEDQLEYLSRPVVHQQLEVLAQDSAQVEKVQIKPAETKSTE